MSETDEKDIDEEAVNAAAERGVEVLKTFRDKADLYIHIQGYPVPDEGFRLKILNDGLEEVDAIFKAMDDGKGLPEKILSAAFKKVHAAAIEDSAFDARESWNGRDMENNYIIESPRQEPGS